MASSSTVLRRALAIEARRRCPSRSALSNVSYCAAPPVRSEAVFLPASSSSSSSSLSFQQQQRRQQHQSPWTCVTVARDGPIVSGTSRCYVHSSARKRGKGGNSNQHTKPQEHHNNEVGEGTARQTTHRHGKNKNRRGKYKRSKSKARHKPKPKPAPYQHRTHGETGRPIMTKERLGEVEQQLQLGGSNGHSSAKRLVHLAQRKMYFQQQYEHVAEGPNNDRLFLATLRTTIDRRIVSNSTIVDDTEPTIELVNTGASRSKKGAESLAASDLCLNLAELGINIRNPPDFAAQKKAEAKERFKSNVQEAQMLLEVLGTSRPQFETTAAGRQKFVSEVSLQYRGMPISATGELGRSKAEAEGRTLLALTARGSELEEHVGSGRMASIRKLVGAAPAGHVAALHIPPLPDEALDILTEALGTRTDHLERMDMHAEAKARYEKNFHEQRRRRNVSESSSRGKARSRTGHREDMAEINEAFIKEENARMEEAEENPEGKQGKMKSLRDALPIKAIAQDLIEALKLEQVVVVSGGTGSGKSTQCPQYILEDCIAQGKGADTRIVVTQPRRIAAISVAERVAAERIEGIGNSVGYTVRFNRQAPRDTGGSIEFVTTGVLLRRLVNDPSLNGISHVVIDEVHERDIDTDFLLVLLRDLLVKRPDLRVILMSATLDAESFGVYFSRDKKLDSAPVPVMSVPTAPRHPVEVVHLEDVADPTSEGLSKEIQELARSLLRLHDQQLQLELEEATAEEAAAIRLTALASAEDEGEILDDSSDSDSDEEYGDDIMQSPMTRLEKLRRAVSMRAESGSSIASFSSSSHQAPNEKREIGEITTKLLAKIAQHVAQVETDAGRKGSILCFLPGLDEIKEAMKMLEEESDPFLKKSMKILPLHSTIPQDDQQKVFIPAADGTVKVILATNIAESSVTIDDVLVVVDGGLVRELNWDAEKHMSNMVTVPTSKASATQRLGRAGRVAPGKCYRIYSRGQHHAMLERPMPEIQRTALEATCLQTCTMTDDSVEMFLQRAMDPPKEDAVRHSMDRLKKLGAITVDPSLDGRETLSPLGHCLSRLPLDPATGRMLIMGCVVQCLDPVLTAAACFSSKEVFYTPPGQRERQRNIRQSFSGSSDILATVQAYDLFQIILREEGWGIARQWASDNFISVTAITSINSVRSQLLNELHRIGLVENRDLVRARDKNKQLHFEATVNKNAGSDLLHSAVWSCGLPDNLASRRQLGSFGTLRTRMENHAGLHPSSVAFHRKPPQHRHERFRLAPWFFYREMILSSQVFLRGCTALKPEQIILFGGYSLGDIDEKEEGQKVLDDWICVETSCDDTLNLLSAARSEINAALDVKVMNPRKPLPEAQQSIIDGVCDCFDILDERDT